MYYLTELQIHKAYIIWWRSYRSQKFDDEMFQFLVQYNSLPTFARFFQPGIVRDTRKALLISCVEMAKRLKISRETYYALEKSELNGTIKIKTLEHIAEEMDCDFTYYFIPKNKKTFSRNVWEKLYPQVIEQPRFRVCTEVAKPDVLAMVVNKQLKNKKFQELNGLTSKSN